MKGTLVHLEFLTDEQWDFSAEEMSLLSQLFRDAFGEFLVNRHCHNYDPRYQEDIRLAAEEYVAERYKAEWAQGQRETMVKRTIKRMTLALKLRQVFTCWTTESVITGV